MEVELFVRCNRPFEDEKIIHQCANIEVEKEYDVNEIKGCIKCCNSVLYHVKWLGFPKKTDWTFEPYENISKGVGTKLLQFHINYPNAPGDHRVTSEP